MASNTSAFSKSILLIEDDIELCALMKNYFAHYEWGIEFAYDGRDGLAKALENKFDLIILDVMLPVLDGFQLLRQIRERSTIPIIMLTARAAQTDRIFGLDAGADDYLPKPFEPAELSARIRAVFRRVRNPGPLQPRFLEAGEVKLNLQRHEVWANSTPVVVTSIEFDILELLVRAAGRAVTRDELAASLYQRSLTPFERSIDVHICHLRKKLEGHALILSIRGIGYLFTPDSVREP